MLARRFTIVCLLMTLFGMFFSILVADASRPRRDLAAYGALACLLDGKRNCRAP